MQLLTAELRLQLPPLYSQEKNGCVAESMGERGYARLSGSCSLHFLLTFYGSSGRCQGFASPRKNRAPLTPPRASNKSY